MASNEELIAMGLKEDGKKEVKEKSNSSFKKMETKTQTTQNITNKYIHKNNSMATILSIIGILEIIASFIVGIIMGDTYQTGIYVKEFNTLLCIIIIIVGFVTGIFILGFSEVIQKLQNIEDNTKVKN